MAKRSWLQANESPQVDMGIGPAAATTSRRRGYDLLPGSLPPPSTTGEMLGGPSAYLPTGEQPPRSLTSVEISRKVKACAACRKQKIRCHMDDGKPPCTRCKQRNLPCVLNKSLQMLMEEKSQWHQDIVKDLELLHSGLQEARQQIALHPLAHLRSSGERRDSDTIEPGGQTLDERESERNSPEFTSLFDDTAPPAATAEYPGGRPGSPPFPYAFSTMEAQPNQPPMYGGESSGGKQSAGVGPVGVRDFIAAGKITVTDAQRLLDVYINGLDRFVDNVLVAALHDRQSDRIYPICKQELRRLIESSLFDQDVSRDYVWALCIASYWLSDDSWTLCGVAIRRATEMNLAGSYQRVMTQGNEEAAESLRLWYLLYLCDRNICYSFGRESFVRADPSVLGWNQFLQSPAARTQDKPLVMMLGLYPILGPARDVFGLDNRTPILEAFSTQIGYYGQQLDQWLRVWLNVLQDATGTEWASRMLELPATGAMLQYHFARLYLCSHVFRGLPPNAPIPETLREAARNATTAAMDMIQLCLTDPHMGGVALWSVPTHVFGMLCFACAFLLHVAVKRRDGLVEVGVVSGLAARFVQELRGMSVSAWHPAYAVADILDKTAASLLNLEATSSGKSREESRRASTTVATGGTASMMEEAFKRAVSLFPDSNMSEMGMGIGGSSGGGEGEGGGGGGGGTSMDSPGLRFGTSNFFDFGDASQSGQGGV